jgi:signal transduction histidine kinase
VLVEASPALVEQPARRKAQLLSAFLVVVLPFGVLSSGIRLGLDPGYGPAFQFQAPIYGLLVGVYLLSRTRHSSWAALATLILGELMAFGLIYQRPSDLLLQATPLVPILLASLLFSWRATALFSLANLAIMGALGWAVPEAEAIHIWTSTTFVGVCAIVVVLSGRFQVLMERDRQQELQVVDRMTALGTLAAGVAHEINNPLTYVRGNLDLLEEQMRRGEDRITPTMIGRLETAIEGLARVEQIVGDMRTFSRQESEVVGPVNVEAVVRSALDMVRYDLRCRAEVVQHFEPGLPDALASEPRLVQVMLNLLVNALQSFTDADPSRNTVRVEAWKSGDGRLMIEVSDNGVGIAAPYLPRVFTPFFTTKASSGGTGLGLSMCRSIIVRMQGEIRVESQLGRGTRFIILLPAANMDDVQHRPAPSNTEHSAGSGPKRVGRILVIDNEPAILSLVQEVLKDHQVTVAGTGQEAIAHLWETEYDLILCDLMMPGLSGIDVYQQTVRQKPALAEKFIFVTGGSLHAPAQEFLAEREQPWVKKPFRAAELRALVDSQLEC